MLEAMTRATVTAEMTKRLSENTVFVQRHYCVVVRNVWAAC